MPGYTPTPENLQIKEVYGDWVNANAGTNLHGGIAGDGAWQGCCCELAVMPSCHYDASSGKLDRHFVGDLVEELHGVQDRHWNSERFIVF